MINLSYQSNRIPVQAMAADSAYFELFPYRVLQGSVSLEDPASVLLMEGFAKKLFRQRKSYWQDSHLFEWKGD